MSVPFGYITPIFLHIWRSLWCIYLSSQKHLFVKEHDKIDDMTLTDIVSLDCGILGTKLFL